MSVAIGETYVPVMVIQPRPSREAAGHRLQRWWDASPLRHSPPSLRQGRAQEREDLRLGCLGLLLQARHGEERMLRSRVFGKLHRGPGRAQAFRVAAAVIG